MSRRRTKNVWGQGCGIPCHVNAGVWACAAARRRTLQVFTFVVPMFADVARPENCWLAGWLAGRLAGWRLAEWLAGWLAGWPIRFMPQNLNNKIHATENKQLRFVPQNTNNKIRSTENHNKVRAT